MIKWNLTRVLHSAGGRVLLFVLFLCSLLFSSLPVSAYVLTSTNKGNINAVNLSGSGGTGYLNYSYYDGGVRFRLVNTNVSGPQLFLALELSSPIPAQSLVSISLSVSGADTTYSPICFSGSYNRQVIDCSINGDNGNYTISAVFYMTEQVSSIVLWNAVPNPNLKNQPGAWLNVNDPYYSHVSKEFSDTDVGIVKDLLSDIKDGTDSIDSNIEAYMGQESARWTQIKQFLGDIYSNTGDIKTKLDSVNSNVIAQGQATQQSIDNQTQQQEEQYEQEKQEESDREEQGNADSQQAQGLFNFSVFNPFGAIFGLFSDGCVSLPTVGGMLNKPDATMCPWFPSSIRSVLTPVFGLASSMLLFGFVVRWLSGNSGDIYGARNFGKELD